MKHLSLIATTITLVIPAFAADSDNTRRAAQDRTARAERREAKQEIEKLIQDINALDNQPAARQAGIAEAARQAAVPASRLESASKDQRNLAGLFLVQEIAKNTKKSPQEIQKARAEAQNWTQVATENKQDLAALELKLQRIHQAMLDPNGTQARTGASASAAAAPGSPNVLQNQTTAAEPAFDRSIQSVNSLGQEQEARRLGVDAIARESALSRQQVEQAADQNKQMGLGDLFVAQQLSSKTKKSISELWNQHLSPKSWTDIAQENNQNAAQLERQLARVEDTMRGRAPQPDDAQRVREREQNRRRGDATANPARATFDETAFQTSIQAVNSLGQNANAQSTGLAAMARETALPLTQIEQARQQNQGMGLGDLFVAQELSAKTKKSVNELWQAHLNQRTWAQVAADNNQDIGEIQRKLASVEKSLREVAK
ncbi:MAG TPA: hypothetical protein VGF13_13885 [Verrucomicrobiae bacterium]|jgi:hypothetical protein